MDESPDIPVADDESRDQVERLIFENETLRLALSAIAGQRPEDHGTTRMDAAEFARITLRSLSHSPEGHAFVQNPRNPKETDCDVCGIMRDLHGSPEGPQ